MKCYSDMSIWNASIRKHQNISTSHTLVPPEETVWWLSTNIGSASEVPGAAGWWPGEARVAMGEQPGSETGSSIPATSRTLTHLYRQQPATTCAWPPCCLQSPQEPPHPVLAFIVLYMFLPPCVCVLRMLSWKLLLGRLHLFGFKCCFYPATDTAPRQCHLHGLKVQHMLHVRK